MYESRTQRLLSRPLFFKRLSMHVMAAAGMLSGSLLIGMAGYIYYEKLPWVDAFLNAAMLLGGMGPVDPPHTNGGKIFAGVYALYAGLLFLVTVGVILAPILHRALHKFYTQRNT